MWIWGYQLFTSSKTPITIIPIANQRSGDIFSPRINKASIAVMTNTRLPSGEMILISSFARAPNQNTADARYRKKPKMMSLFNMIFCIFSLLKIFVGSWISFIWRIPDFIDIWQKAFNKIHIDTKRIVMTVKLLF